MDELVVRTYYLGGEPQSEDRIRDEDLLLGVPAIYRKPVIPKSIEAAPERLALTQGDAYGYDPGERVLDAHVM